MKYIPILLLLFFSCKKDKYEDYKYWVGGSGGDYLVTLQNSHDQSQQWSSVGSGFYYTWKQTGKRWLYLSAQNNNAGGDVEVRIYKNGTIIAKNKSYGGYSIATVSGTY